VRASNALCLALLFISCQGHAEDFRGRVVGITDGDTISVMHSGRAEKIRHCIYVFDLSKIANLNKELELDSLVP
jgi:hypothetical protein